MKQQEMRRSGVLLHISSLPGPYGCGAFGKEARHFVDFLADSGFTVWQVLPFCMPDGYNSPYSSYGAFSGNPNFIDLEALFTDSLISEAELISARVDDRYTAAFERLSRERIPLLLRAADRVRDRAPILRFMEENPRVDEFCRFMAIREKNGNGSSFDFTTDAYDDNVYFGWQFIQYTFFTQWQELKNYANARGISVIGDIPIYVSMESADVYMNPDLFLLDASRRPTAVAGVPPDAFSADGQLWGNPLYDWERMKSDSFSWWRERMAHMLSLFDGVRLDHFRGFESYYAIGSHEVTARNGRWRKGPGNAFVRAMRDLADGSLMIAEDLGVITPAVDRLVKNSGFYRMAVAMFAFDGEASRHLPYRYDEKTVAYTGTHDNNTLLGFLFETSSEVRESFYRYVGLERDDIHEACRLLLRALLASHAGIVIFPMQDLLLYGADTRMNTPGRAEGNWSYRVTEEQLRLLSPITLRRENSLYGRCD